MKLFNVQVPKYILTSHNKLFVFEAYQNWWHNKRDLLILLNLGTKKCNKNNFKLDILEAIDTNWTTTSDSTHYNVWKGMLKKIHTIKASPLVKMIFQMSNIIIDNFYVEGSLATEVKCYFK